MIRLSARFFSAVALIVLFVPVFQAVAQQHVPPAPDSGAQQGTPVPEAPVAQSSAPAQSTAPAFPKPDPADFNASAPSKELVGAFLQANWGFDDNRVWQVQAILNTPVDGVSKVRILVADKGPNSRIMQMDFFVLPDGKHIIFGDQVISFGAHPFADIRQQLQQRAEGPYRGSADKNLEIVEFADFQCPHSKDAQANMEKLVVDYPKARIVFQNFPLAAIHPESVIAAEYGVCVNKIGGSKDFFQFAASVFDGQDGLATADGATLTLNSAVAKVGLDPAKVAACAATPEIKAAVDASIKLGTDLGIDRVPMLVINGYEIQPNMSYDQLKKIIEFQVKADGVALQ